MTDFADKSAISPKTKIAAPVAVVVTVLGAAIYWSWVFSRTVAVQEASSRQTQEQLGGLTRKVDKIDDKMQEANVRLIRLEFKVDDENQPKKGRR